MVGYGSWHPHSPGGTPVQAGRSQKVEGVLAGGLAVPLLSGLAEYVCSEQCHPLKVVGNDVSFEVLFQSVHFIIFPLLFVVYCCLVYVCVCVCACVRVCVCVCVCVCARARVRAGSLAGC